MENVQGGNVNPDCMMDGAVFTAGVAVGIVAVGALTGGVGFAVAGLLFSWVGVGATIGKCS